MTKPNYQLSVEFLVSEDDHGHREWSLADRRISRTDRSPAVALDFDEADALVRQHEIEGSITRVVVTEGSLEVHPLRAVVALAALRLQAFEDDDSVSQESPRLVFLREDLEEARAALAGSDCPRQWELREEGFAYVAITASSAEEALEVAVDNCDRANYPDSVGTLFIDVSVECEETGERDSKTVTLEPDEPDCARGHEHDWQSPHALVGGLEENPGVHGHGGGVIIAEVCPHCGCKRVTDTWGQNPSNGQQGLRTVSYEEEAYTAEEIAEAFGEGA